MKNTINAGNCTGIYEQRDWYYVVYWDMGCPETTMNEKKVCNRCEIPANRWDEYLNVIEGMKSYDLMVDESIAFSRGATHKVCTDGKGKSIQVPLFKDPQEVDYKHNLVYTSWVYMRDDAVVYAPN